MSWTDSDLLPFLDSEDYQLQLRPFKINERCFIRKDHRCGKIFGASKSCFIACPSEDALETILELISEKLTKVGIEATIAVKERAYGQDIFCTKICGKIIESKFCLAILDDLIDKERNIPNPNVYYEYGLMTSLEKHIIPLQKEDLKLAFNIQSYDTIKYNSKNIGSELDRAIKDAIKITESKDKTDKKETLSERSILRSFELAGFELKDEKWFLDDVINDTDFKGFGHHKEGFYAYMGKLDNENEMKPYLEDLYVVLYRTEKKYQELVGSLKSIETRWEEGRKQVKEKPATDEGREGLNIFSKYNILFGEPEKEIKDIKDKINLMSNIYIGFIINHEIDRSDFVNKAEALISKNDKFKLVCENNNEMTFGKVKVNFSSLSL